MSRETYQEAAERLSAGLPVHVDHPDSHVWLRWADKTLQPFPGGRTRAEWDAVGKNSIMCAD